MAKKFGFFNSINGDRKYLASDISQAFDIGVTTGIKAEENNLKVVVYEGMQVQIQPGSAMIFGHFFMNDEPEIIDIDTADAELNRIDRVVVRYDAYTREVNTAVIKGSPALSPTPPARLETGEQFDLVLADIYVPAAATVINTSNITDMRDSELCGYIGVKGAVSQLQFDAHLSENSRKHITESGSNDDGYYIRFDDGTQICTYIASVTDQAITDVYGSLYIGTRTWHYPALFASNPVAISGTFKWGSSASWGTCNSSSVSSAEMRVYDIKSRASGEETLLKFAAIGRWK